jgi:hypothetical protein
MFCNEHRKFVNGFTIDSGSALIGFYPFPGSVEIVSRQDLFQHGFLLAFRVSIYPCAEYQLFQSEVFVDIKHDKADS